jgi:hypothetical protein
VEVWSEQLFTPGRTGARALVVIFNQSLGEPLREIFVDRTPEPARVIEQSALLGRSHSTMALRGRAT